MDLNDIATKQDLQRLEEKINRLVDLLTKLKAPAKNSADEIYLTSKEVMEIYKMSKSHLSDLRNEGRISCTKPFGTLLYPKSEIEKMIREGLLNR